VKNPRYNPKGATIGIDFKLPFDDNEFDIIYLYSVFSHMTTDDVEVYLKEFKRLLTRSGKIFLTAFIADGVSDMTINPPDYQLKNWSGPLHCVRYNKDFFSALLAENDFVLDRIDYEQETNGQSALYISKREQMA
jgi:ubiquinone/menaquinone biosynthesis C-methylase UbiE